MNPNPVPASPAAAPIGHQAAMIGDVPEESAGWAVAGSARALAEEQGRMIAAATGA